MSGPGSAHSCCTRDPRPPPAPAGQSQASTGAHPSLPTREAQPAGKGHDLGLLLRALVARTWGDASVTPRTRTEGAPASAWAHRQAPWHPQFGPCGGGEGDRLGCAQALFAEACGEPAYGIRSNY